MKTRYYWYMYTITRNGILRERGTIRARSLASAYGRIARSGMSASEALAVKSCTAKQARETVTYVMPLGRYQEYYQ